MLEMPPGGIGMIHCVGAAGAEMLGAWCQHEGIDGELAVTVEQIGQGARAIWSLEEIVLVHPHPRQRSTLGTWCIEGGVGHGAFLLEQCLVRAQPVLARNDLVGHGPSPFMIDNRGQPDSAKGDR